MTSILEAQVRGSLLGYLGGGDGLDREFGPVIVGDAAGRVLCASSAARGCGLVQGDRLVVAEILELARLVRLDQVVRQGSVQVWPAGRWFAVRVAPLASYGLVLVQAEDLTEARRVEGFRRDFVAEVSHELKNPVGALAALAETMESAVEEPEAVRRFAKLIRQESLRLTNLVQDLMTLSRGAGVAMRAVSLDEVVAEALERCRLKSGAKEIELVRQGVRGLKLHGEEELLTTALRNLIDNAVAYSPERTRVVVRTGSLGDLAEVSVADQGIGIPAAEQERIFERFYRVDTARSGQGTGVGLAIVKQVTAQHGGAVTVASREGRGSTFTLRLPLLDSFGHRRRDREVCA